MSETVFSKIIRREIPAEFIHEDDQCIAIRDANPQAPVHILLIPKQPLAMLSMASESDAALLGHLMLTAADIARREGCGEAFRLVVNNGETVGQTVFHLHLHILAGRPFSWPPG